MRNNRAPSHFIYLSLLALFWGSAYMFAKIALDSITPLTLAASRILIGAIVMTVITLSMKAKLPRSLSDWRQCSLIGITGSVIPFLLINWSIQYVPSSLAAICMALLPLFTMILAHYMTHDEKFSHTKLIGIIFGILGISSLFYGTITAVDGAPFVWLALSALVVTSFFYALSGVLVKNLNNKDVLGTASAMLISASIFTIPLAFIFEDPLIVSPSGPALFSVLVLGIFATGIAALIMFHLTHLAGATFVSYCTYLIPPVGMIAGYIWLDEPLKATYLISVMFILAGIYLAEKKGKPRLSTPVNKK